MAKALAWRKTVQVNQTAANAKMVGAEIYPNGRDERAEIARHDMARQRMLLWKTEALADRVEWELRWLELNAEGLP